METSLHRQLKLHYAGQNAAFEVPVGAYRVDVVRGDLLIEIQHGALGAIRDKVRDLLRSHSLLVVKPLVARKRLVKLAAKGGPPVEERWSPKSARILDLFDELVHFTHVFPHPRLTLEVPLLEVEEHRYPGHGRRRRWRVTDHEVEDQRLVEVRKTYRFKTVGDLLALLPRRVPKPLDTAALAKALDIRREFAQRIAYCLVQMGGLVPVGKRGNARLYEIAAA